MQIPAHHFMYGIRNLYSVCMPCQELFQGKTKRFDVTKALAATSLREFDTAVSMVSYGFDFIEDFYSNSSTRELVGSVKIPVLFIQVYSLDNM